MTKEQKLINDLTGIVENGSRSRTKDTIIALIRAALASYAEQDPQPIEKIEQLGGQVNGKSAEADFVAEAEWKRRDFGNKMYTENWWENAPVDVRVAIEDMLIFYDQMLDRLNKSGWGEYNNAKDALRFK